MCAAPVPCPHRSAIPARVISGPSVFALFPPSWEHVAPHGSLLRTAGRTHLQLLPGGGGARRAAAHGGAGGRLHPGRGRAVRGLEAGRGGPETPPGRRAPGHRGRHRHRQVPGLPDSGPGLGAPPGGGGHPHQAAPAPAAGGGPAPGPGHPGPPGAGGAGQGPRQLPLQDRLGGPGGPSARRSSPCPTTACGWPCRAGRGRPGAGDREELGRYGEGESELWDKVNARAERCTGRQCPRFEECHLTRLRQEILEADIVVANHALLLADRVLRESAFGQVLPDAPVLILDEAHEIEEQLTESCAEQWSNRAMTLLFRDLARGGRRRRPRPPPWRPCWGPGRTPGTPCWPACPWGAAPSASRTTGWP